MEVNDEKPHLGVIHRLLGFGPPGCVGTRVVGVQADDFHLRKVLERVVFKVVQLAAEDEMQQLLRGTIWHDPFSLELRRLIEVFRTASNSLTARRSFEIARQ